MAKGSGLEDLALAVGLGVVGYFAYDTWWKGKGIEDIMTDINTHLTTFVDSVFAMLPSLPPVPQFQMPSSFPQSIPSSTSSLIPQSPPALGNVPNLPATNTLGGLDEPSAIKPPNPPKGSGQLPTNPAIPPPPSGSGGAIVGFAGDWHMNNAAKQTTASMDKAGVSFIIGCGDYSYGPAAKTWFDQIIGPRFATKFKGAQGNHDNDSYLAVFGQKEWNFQMKVAPNLSVVFIDTEGGIDEATLTTLTKAAKAQTKFVAYTFHKPYVTSSDGHHKGSENKSGAIIEKVARAMGIKLIVAGHNHVYEHFFDGGIHYVTSGAAGSDFYKTGCLAPGKVKCLNNTTGWLKVAVGNTLVCQFVNNSGTPLDTFTIS